MGHVFTAGSKCICGGKFVAIEKKRESDPPTGAYVQCNNTRCKKQAVVPEIYHPWKKAQEEAEKKGEGK